MTPDGSASGESVGPPADDAIWEGTAEAYGETWEPLTTLYVEDLLGALDLAAGARLLDLGCGTGAVAAAARRRGLRVLASDRALSMTAWAGRRSGASSCFAADACHLPLANGVVAGVAMNFALHHVPDPHAALREMSAVLEPGGRIAYTSWAPPEENPASARLNEVYERHLGPLGQLQGAAFPLGLRDSCAAELGRSGFLEPSVRLRAVTRAWRPPSADAAFDAELRGGGRKSLLLSRESDASRARIRDAIREVVADYVTDDGIAIPMTAYLVVAEREATDDA